MDINDLFPRFAVALGIGLLIGLERGWHSRDEKPGKRTAGIRTFALTGLLGGTMGALAQNMGGPASVAGGVLLGLSFAAYSGALAIFCREENRAEGTFSATTAVAGMLTFALSAYALAGDIRIAAAAAVAATALLAIRERLHSWVRRMSWAELRAALVLLAMTVIALPLLPDTPVGPFGGVNPREVWAIAIVLAGVSFLGYVALRQFGPSQGVLVGAAIGGLVSSTAVTLTNARHVVTSPRHALLLAGGVCAATAVCFLRITAVVAALQPSLLALMLLPLLAATIVATICAVLFVFLQKDAPAGRHAFRVSNPFSFWPVIGFAAMLGALILLAREVNALFGLSGLIAGAVTLGLADMDSVTVSVSRLVPEQLVLRDAALAILAAAASNTLGKIAIAGVLGRARFALLVGSMAIASVAAGGIVFWLELVSGAKG